MRLALYTNRCVMCNSIFVRSTPLTGLPRGSTGTPAGCQAQGVLQRALLASRVCAGRQHQRSLGLSQLGIESQGIGARQAQESFCAIDFWYASSVAMRFMRMASNRLQAAGRQWRSKEAGHRQDLSGTECNNLEGTAQLCGFSHHNHGAHRSDRNRRTAR